MPSDFPYKFVKNTLKINKEDRRDLSKICVYLDKTLEQNTWIFRKS